MLNTWFAKLYGWLKKTSAAQKISQNLTSLPKSLPVADFNAFRFLFERHLIYLNAKYIKDLGIPLKKYYPWNLKFIDFIQSWTHNLRNILNVPTEILSHFSFYFPLPMALCVNLPVLMVILPLCHFSHSHIVPAILSNSHKHILLMKDPVNVDITES